MKRPFCRMSAFAMAIAAVCLITTLCLVIGVLTLRPQQSSTSRELVHRAHDETADEGRVDPPNENSVVTAGEIRDALLAAAAKLVDLKIVVVEQGNFNERTPDLPVPVPVVFKEMWLHGTSAQVRMDWRYEGNGAEWWKGFETIEGPMTSAHLLSAPGMRICFDLSRDLAFANSGLQRPGPGGEIRTIHFVSKSPKFASNLFVPLVEFDKPWVPPERRNGAPVVDQIARLPLSAWRLLDEAKLQEDDVVCVEICRQDTLKIPLKQHTGELEMTPVYLAWFAKNCGWMPVRIEQSMRYGYQGRDCWLERRTDGQSSLVYEATDFVRLKDVWVPRTGSQSAFRPKEQEVKGFDPDSLAERVLAEGTIRFPGEMRLGYRYEWKILSIEPIDPSLNLWFEPQNGAEVLNTDTHKRFIQGDAVASARFAAREQAIEAPIGKPAPEFPAAATWINGQPLTWKALHGKVVILGFWAEWCGPCRGDLPELCKLHQNRQENGLTIIGVHLSGTELAVVEKSIKDLQLAYPICIDIPKVGKSDDGDEGFSSEFASQFGVNKIPHFVVVNQAGIVAASVTGSAFFEDARAIAEELAKKKD